MICYLQMDEKYQNGKIYRLTCDDLELQYYGSTIQTLTRRLQAHKDSYTSWCKDNTKQYCSSYELFKVGNVEIELVYECPCNSRRELEECEQVFIDNDFCINKQNAFTSKEDLREQWRKSYSANRDKKLEQKRKYLEENRDKINQKRRERSACKKPQGN